MVYNTIQFDGWIYVIREIRTEIIINAPIEKIWSILTDFESYSVWNPFIQSIEGRPNINERLVVTIYPPNKKPMTFRPKIISISNYELTWIGNLLLPGIFDGEHHFALIPISDDNTKFLHSEKFSGLLCSPIFGLIGETTKVGFENMNMAFKKQSES